MELYPINSNMVEAIGYDPDYYILQVVYTGGKTFEYADVPPEVWEELYNAESVGNYLMNNIMDNYQESEL
jgi:hypothetical protein